MSGHSGDGSHATPLLSRGGSMKALAERLPLIAVTRAAFVPANLAMPRLQGTALGNRQCRVRNHPQERLGHAHPVRFNPLRTRRHCGPDAPGRGGAALVSGFNTGAPGCAEALVIIDSLLRRHAVSRADTYEALACRCAVRDTQSSQRIYAYPVIRPALGLAHAVAATTTEEASGRAVSRDSNRAHRVDSGGLWFRPTLLGNA